MKKFVEDLGYKKYENIGSCVAEEIQNYDYILAKNISKDNYSLLGLKKKFPLFEINSIKIINKNSQLKESAEKPDVETLINNSINEYTSQEGTPPQKILFEEGNNMDKNIIIYLK
jgi:hypothetical protein